MVAVMLFERDERRYAHRQIGKVAEHAIGEWTMRAEGKIVRYLVQAHWERVIQRAAHHVGEYEQLRPGAVAHHVGHKDLYKHSQCKLYCDPPVAAH